MFWPGHHNGSTKSGHAAKGALAKALKSVEGLSTIRLGGGSEFGYYWITLQVGSPPQPQTVLIHTQSQKIAFPCSMCKPDQCPKHEYPPFDYKKSMTSKNLKCEDKFMNWHCGGRGAKPQSTCPFSLKFGPSDTLSGWVFKDKIGMKADPRIQVGRNLTFWMKKKKQRSIRRRLLVNRRRVKFLKTGLDKSFPQFEGVFGCTEKQTGFFKT